MMTIPAMVLLSLFGQVEVKHEDPPFTFPLPAGYVAVLPPPTGCEYAWKRPSGEQDKLVLTVQVLAGRVPMAAGNPENLSEKMERLFQGRPFTLRKFPWKGFELLIVGSEIDLKDGKGTVLSAEVPVKPKGLLLRIGGPSGQREAIDREFDAILSSIQAETTWMSWPKGIFALGTAVGVLGGWSLYAIYGIVYLIYYRTRPEAALSFRATWLATTAVLMLLGLVSRIGVAALTPGDFNNLNLAGIFVVIDAGRRARKHFAALRESLPVIRL